MRPPRSLGRRGKVFSIGLLIFFIIISIAALITVLTRFNAVADKLGVGQAVGDIQGAMLAAYERADQKVFYAQLAGEEALREAMRQLYQDQRAFFSQQQGDIAAGLDCGSYAYPRWNTNEKVCLSGGSGALQHIIDSLAPRTLELLSQRTATYPNGGFTPSYTLVANADGNNLSLIFHGAVLEEPIFLGLQASAPATKIAQTIETSRSTQGLLWPILGGGQTITSCFGLRSGNVEHRGMDLRNTGDVVAAADGTVLAIGDVYTNMNGGKYVWLLHKDLSTRYLHLDPASITVKVGDSVKAGQVIGRPGLGLDVAPHLHFEVLLPNPPAGGLSFPVNSLTSSWYAINPLCLYPEEITSKIDVKQGDDACAQQGSAAPRGWCDVYGLTPGQVQAYAPSTAISSTQGQGAPATTQQPAVGPEPTRPTNVQLTPGQAAKFQTTEQNQYKYGWNQYVIQAAASTGVDQALILGVITQESLGEPLAISSTGCAGIMQICYNTGLNLPGLGTGSMVTCGQGCKYGSCACNTDNDRRFQPEVAIPAGVALLKQNLDTFSTYTHRVEFAIAAYNSGPPAVKNAIHALGGDPSWDDVAAYMTKHPEVITVKGFNLAAKQAQVKQVTDYVPNVMAYTQAWSGGAPVDQGHAAVVAATQAQYGAFERIGTFTYDPSFSATLPDTLTPFVNLLNWANVTLTHCAAADIPRDCFVSEMKKAKPEVTQTCEEDAAVQYFSNLYQALRDCSENKQYSCQCPLPTPPASISGEYVLTFDATKRPATLTKDGAPVSGLYFENISAKTLRIAADRPEGTLPATFLLTLKPDSTQAKLLLDFTLAGETKEQEWPAEWSVEKGDDEQQLIVRKDASGVESCAQVKTLYALCSKIVDGMPAVKFALTIKDETKPNPPTNLIYDPATKTVTFTSSSSKDVAFYNVYDTQPSQDLKPLFQVRRQSNFDASSYVGKTLYLTAVDQVGNEGATVSFAIPVQPP